MPDANQINNGEKVRMCYLISRLADTLESPQREQWLNDILANLDIKMRFYRSKYRQPISDMPSECNKAFADALREIFGTQTLRFSPVPYLYGTKTKRFCADGD